jgi:chorismate dehydratase
MSARLGAVSYLNARPLTVALGEGDGDFELAYSVPSLCAADLHAGRIDAGLIPSIEYARSREPYCIVPEVAIGARGEVLTVRLFWRGELKRVRRVALDTGSRTSACLLRILLREQYGLEPEFIEAKPDLNAMLREADAALIIGDAVFAVDGDGIESLDLGREWVGMTGHPFVFAFWAGRPEGLNTEQVEALIVGRDVGLSRVEEVAEDFFRRSGHGPSAEFYAHYLTDHIRFELGTAELKGLATFYRLAADHGLIEAAPELRFYERAAARESERLTAGG